MATSSAPMEIGHVALTVHDLAGVGAFYQAALGLERIGGSGEVQRFGAGDRVLLELRQDKAARQRSSREAGLFHTAFLLPSRAALGRWLRHAAETRVPIQGASDHLVSEAIYLADPEGNGIEIYCDRPRDAWTILKDGVKMATEPLDFNGVAAAADGPWNGAPEGSVVGHVHLQVGAVPEAEAFYRDSLGFEVMAHYPGATFLASGGYHHHLGANVWNSRGAKPRDYPSTGLAEVQILAAHDALASIRARNGGDLPKADPWATAITLTGKAA